MKIRKQHEKNECKTSAIIEYSIIGRFYHKVEKFVLQFNVNVILIIYFHRIISIHLFFK